MTVTEISVSFETAQKLGLLKEEYERIVEILGRVPNFTELSIFSVMWSEHCSYKNSIKYLKTLPRDGGRLLVGAGEENAGLVDIGDGLACAFKIESHNHPSAIEPYQGAATGVGGIHRDIFTMGARPIAALNSLRFGNPEINHTKHLVKGVVSGIGGYGNCLGVPTIGGEVYFDECYNQNILVNAMSVGIVEQGKTISAIAEGVGNPVFIVGSATGKDGIHGATFASADLNEDSADDLPAVQVGDPFQEKLLLEATLELIESGAVVGMQDMGAAGITCSTSEMSAKSGTGMKIDLDKVPTRQSNMQAFEILLSESQERMLIVAHQGQESTLYDIFDKWDLECAEIGVVTDTQKLEFYHHGELVAEVPAEPLVLGGGAPVYDREYRRPTYFDSIEAFDINTIPDTTDIVKDAKTVCSSPNILSKKWIYNQYDSMVRTNTMTTNDPSDASVIRVKDTNKALACTTDCNSSYVYADPYKGAMIAVSEAARNLVCSGANPVAITNCLNFGNPYNPEVYYQFVYAIKGMGDACRKFGTPVTGGNVSFYNQSQIKDQTIPVYPTPTIGMLGIIDDVEDFMTLYSKQVGDSILLIGKTQEDIGQSEYLKRVHNIKNSPAPYFDLEEEYHLQKSLARTLKLGIIKSAHDVSEGGLFNCLLEKSYANDLGFEINFKQNGRLDAYLFGESQSRVVVTIANSDKKALLNHLTELNVPFTDLGSTTDGFVKINGIEFGNIKEWKSMHDHGLEEILEK
ncbi:MAG: phosphoribosylformylglycinamidine synthase subunit PurL [Saprospiraceae bacterium]|nr:phosphoribosylformylglycinamidine synthase subunit PurL [Saprospiraceae bacterium]